jgi:hypothetical protein
MAHYVSHSPRLLYQGPLLSKINWQNIIATNRLQQLKPWAAFSARHSFHGVMSQFSTFVDRR